MNPSVRVEVLRGDPDHRRVQRGEVIGPVAIGAELFRADHRVVTRVEEQHDALAAVLGKLERALGAGQLEIGRLLADPGSPGHGVSITAARGSSQIERHGRCRVEARHGPGPPRCVLHRMRAIVLAGGRGSRLRPYTVVLPKPLIPIGDRPVLDIVVRQLQRAGFKRLTVATGYPAELIEAFFGDGGSYGIAIDYFRETRPLGTVGSLALIEGLDQPFLVMNGDVLTDPRLLPADGRS